MKYETDAIVLKVHDSGESDRILTLLSPEFGIIRAFANRSKKINSKMQSATQALCLGHYTIVKYNNSESVSDAYCKEVFFGLRNDITKLALSQYFCAIAMEAVKEDEECEDVFRVLLNSFSFLEKSRRSEACLKAITELRLLCFAGYMPSVFECALCKSKTAESYVFNIAAGNILCDKCSKGGKELTVGVLRAMIHICTSPISKLYSFSLSEDDEKILSELTEQYLLSVTQKSFKALDFYKSVSV